MARNYTEMKDFCAIYAREGAYHLGARGFSAWFLRDNYAGLARRCEPGDRVLDLACGEGCLGAALDVAHLTGMDHAPRALELCTEHHPGRYDRLLPGDLRELDALDLPRPGFERVLCSLSLMYLLPADLDACLREVLRLLVPGGELAFSYPTVSARRAANPTAAELPPGEVLARLKAAGFEAPRAEPLCPLVPPEVVEQSRHPGSARQARRTYEALRATMTLESSYHWLGTAAAPAPAPRTDRAPCA